jgi:hypothetical protein
MRNPNYLSRALVASVGIVLLIILFSDTDMVQTGMEVLTARFESASRAEGGLVEGTIVDRFLGGLIGAITNSGDIPLLGYGMGMGTQAGAQLLTGETGYLIAEGEWGRLIGEMGLFLGLLVIGVRLLLVFKMGLFSLYEIGKRNILPWLLFSFGGITFWLANWHSLRLSVFLPLLAD